MSAFVPGQELSRLFYEEAVRPILDQHLPGLDYSAALLGYGSDVLGYDTIRSTDHGWGPRLVLFLDDSDHTSIATEVDLLLQRAVAVNVSRIRRRFRDGRSARSPAR